MLTSVCAQLAACSTHNLKHRECTQDVGLHQLNAMFPKLLDLHKGQLDAGYVPVPLTCIHGNGVDTDQAYYYDVDNLQAATAPEPTATVTDEGDGTVGLRSLKVQPSF